MDGSLCSGERAEAEAGIDSSFDRTVILLDNIVEVGDHAATTSLAECMTPLQLMDHFWVRRIPVYINHSRARVIRRGERFGKKVWAADTSRDCGRKKSIVAPFESTALYKWVQRPATRIHVVRSPRAKRDEYLDGAAGPFSSTLVHG